MSSEPELTRTVRSWLQGDAHESANRVLDSVLQIVDTTPQRRPSWLARRTQAMNTQLRLALVAAAVVALAVVGLALTTPHTKVATRPTPAPTPIELDARTDVHKPLAGGRYAVVVGPPTASHYWLELALGPKWMLDTLDRYEVAFVDQAGYGAGRFVGFYSVGRVYRDPCHPEGGYAKFGSTETLKDGTVTYNDAGTLAADLRALHGFDAGPVSTKVIDGLTATHFVISNSIDTETAGCTDGELLPVFTTSQADADAELVARHYSLATNGGARQEIWVVERPRSGLTTYPPLLIIGEVGRTNPAADQAALEKIIASLSFR